MYECFKIIEMCYVMICPASMCLEFSRVYPYDMKYVWLDKAGMVSGDSVGVAKCSQLVAIPVVDLIDEVPTVSLSQLELAVEYVLNDISNADTRAVIILPPIAESQMSDEIIDLLASAYNDNIPIILPRGRAFLN